MLEALELADGLLDAGSTLVERLGEAGLVLLVGLGGNDGNNAAWRAAWRLGLLA